MKDDPKQASARGEMSEGFQQVFRGLGDLLEIATKIADAAGTDGGAPGARHTFPRGVHGVYGVSVRVGPGGAPVLRRFGNVRRTAKRRVVVDEAREPMADVFDEDDHFLVVAELPGVDEPAVHWSLRDHRTLVIRADSADRKYMKRLDLPAAVDDHAAVSCYANGVLELKLWKQGR